MKYLPLLTLSVVSMALSAQTVNSSANAAGSAANGSAQATANATEGATAQAGQAEASAAAASSVSAELTKKIDTKNAKVGDEVLAKTTSNARLADGTRLPKGTRLMGTITDVHAKSKEDQTSRLVFSLNRAVLHDGREIPVHAVLRSVAAPAAMATAGADDDMSAGGGAMAGGGAVSGGGRASGGGLLGGATRTTGGLVGSGVGTAGAATNSLAATGSSALRSATDTGVGSVRTAGEAGAGANTLDHVAVANLPGVTFSSAAGANSAGSLDATGRNINLESGTQLTLSVSASRQ